MTIALFTVLGHAPGFEKFYRFLSTQEPMSPMGAQGEMQQLELQESAEEHVNDLHWDTTVRLPLQQALAFACEIVEWYHRAVYDKQDRFLYDDNYPECGSMCHEMEDCWQFQAKFDHQRDNEWKRRYGKHPRHPRRHAKLNGPDLPAPGAETEGVPAQTLNGQAQLRSFLSLHSEDRNAANALKGAIDMWEQTKPLYIFHKDRPAERPGSDLLIKLLKYVAVTKSSESFLRFE